MQYRIPKTIGKCADRLYEIRQQRLELSKKVKELETAERALRAHIIDTLPKSEASGVSGKTARVTVVLREEPQVRDQDAFREYLDSTGRYDLAYKLRAAPPAIRELWDEGMDVPGIEKFNLVTISLNKV